MKAIIKVAVDCIIDAITILTADDRIDENAKMFLAFLKEEKYRGVHCFDNYLHQRAVEFAMLAGKKVDWRQEIYRKKFWQQYAEEFAQYKINTKTKNK